MGQISMFEIRIKDKAQKEYEKIYNKNKEVGLKIAILISKIKVAENPFDMPNVKALKAHKMLIGGEFPTIEL